MRMRWNKFGIVFRPDSTLAWSRTHAMLPTPLLMPELGVLRIFYTGCDEAGIGRPSFIDVDPRDPTRLLRIHREPLLDIGQPGTFDESGVLATSVLRLSDGRLRMYYVGFELGAKIRYRLLTGVAESFDDGESFRRASRTPILDRSDAELYFRAGPFVLQEGGRFRMWYVSGSRWVDLGGRHMPEYKLMYQESDDGISWPTSGQLIMDITGDDEYGFGRPWILRGENVHRMYYSIRRKSLNAYRMGYAESSDGQHWNRMDEHLGLDVGPESYDDHAIMYAAPVVVDGRTWCFYNGNDFGRDGIALALLEQA